MSFALRPYQKDCLDAIIEAIPLQEHILVQAATGAGKTIIFCKLIESLLTEWPHIRIGILAHRRELITQAQDKLLKVWPQAPIGVACASTGMTVDTDKPVVIGSVQTLMGRLEHTAPFDIVIIDECHRIPPINKKSQYQKWLGAMKQYNPRVRILGFTATPFRLGHGYIYGAVKRADHDNLFESLSYRIGIKELQDQGYLCAYRAKGAKNVSQDLKKVKVAGDYNTADLAEVMSRSEHVGSAVRAMEKYAADRKRIVVFCVTIAHAEKVMQAFRKAGHTAACVHSKMDLSQRDMTLDLFEKGLVRIVCNVGVLTEGWDSPAVDCVIMCRPTKSAALYVQMCGRGLRPHPGKTDVLILDLSSNCSAHGDPDTPNVPVPGRSSGTGDPILKVCPKCFELTAVAAKVCRACGYVWPVETVEHHGEVEMKSVAWSQAPAPLAVEIVNVDIEDYTSRAGNNMLRVKLTCQTGETIQPLWVNEFLDFEGNGSKWGRQRARRLWQHLVGTDPPQTVAEARNRYGELQMSLPGRIEIIEKNKWWNVHHWGVKPWNLNGEENGLDSNCHG
ncbi:MAG: DEAD/DEAH box helicase family protein [Desulfatitalea sp.]|nr:DEAD/DEAH box helicase [Desulfatitalea sp.]NNK00908.1 DEAD/DEAH box helicase family protein [Desulfatitalea sp.]